MDFDGPVLDGRWQLGPRLGKGTQAHTFLAKDLKGKEDIVVVKQLSLGEGGWKRYELFEREIRVLRGLRHPGIPRFLASFESSPGTFNLVMERKAGATLRALATRVRFTTPELRDILGRVLAILDHLHRLNPPLVHRDIKPGNLVRAADGAIALVDFGGVRDVAREDGGSTMVGTFGYMAPEQLHGEATAATDIYALGATLVMLAGGVEPEDVPRKGLRMDLPRHLPDLDPKLREILQKMTEPDPEQRLSSARAVLAQLAEPAAPPAGANRAPPAAAAVSLSAPLRSAPVPLRGLPWTPRTPIGLLLRTLLVTFSISGSLALTILRVAVLPIVFGMVQLVVGARHRPAIAGARDEISLALDEGREGFAIMRRRALGMEERRLLP